AAHSADLMFFSFGECDREFLVTEDADSTGLGDVATDIDPGFHFVFEKSRELGRCEDLVFFFVFVLRVEQRVSEASIIGENNETKRIFIESSDRKDPLLRN